MYLPANRSLSDLSQLSVWLSGEYSADLVQSLFKATQQLDILCLFVRMCSCGILSIYLCVCVCVCVCARAER